MKKQAERIEVAVVSTFFQPLIDDTCHITTITKRILLWKWIDGLRVLRRMRWWKVVVGFGALPVGHLLFSAEFDAENTIALLACVPRTIRAVHWATRAGLDYYKRRELENWTSLHQVWASELTSLCKTNGGVYVKAAQLVSTFGAVPMEYRTKLSQLHDRCRPQSFLRIRKSLQKELGEDYTNAFAEIEEEATAAASIAQVHFAKLKSGKHVALKIQYPALEQSVAADLSCLMLISRFADFLFPKCHLQWIFKRLKKEIGDEMDFNIEARNAENLEQSLKHRSDVR